MDKITSIERINIPSITFSYLIKELKGQGIEGSKVKKIQELPNGALKIRLHTISGEKELIITQKYLFVSEYYLPAKMQSSGFGAFLNKHLKSKVLISLKQLGLERILVLEFGSYALVLELFSNGNIILLDESKKILGCMRSEKWGTREIKKGLEYKQPPSPKCLNELQFSEFLSIAKDEKNQTKIVPWLVKNFGVVPPIAEAVVIKLQIDIEILPKKISEEKLKKIYEEIRESQSLSVQASKAFLIKHHDALWLLPFLPSPSFANAVLQEFNNVNQALNEIFLMQEKKEDDKVKKKIEELKRALEKQVSKLEKCEKSAIELKKKAEAIYENFNDISEVFEFAKCEIERKKTKEQIMYNKAFGKVLLKFIDFKDKYAKIEIESKK